MFRAYYKISSIECLSTHILTAQVQFFRVRYWKLLCNVLVLKIVVQFLVFDNRKIFGEHKITGCKKRAII